MNAFTQTVKSFDDFNPTLTRVLGIGGSPRKNGNSDILLNHILRAADSQNLESTSLQLRDVNYQGCIGCEKCRKDKICTGLHDGMSLIYKEILAARGLILVCPTHNYNITAWMKAFIDRLYCFYNFADTLPRQWSSNLANQSRKAVLAAVCEQADVKDMGFTLDAMRLPLEALGYDIVGELSVFGIFHRGKVKNDQEALAEAGKLGALLGQALHE
jgi:multimeric flavodoxin WrbA